MKDVSAESWEPWRAEVLGVVNAAGQGPVAALEGLSGYSGGKVLGLLQRLAQRLEGRPDECYVEIGVFQGLSLLSVARAAPGVACFGIDNFSQFDEGRQNRRLVEQRRAALAASNATLVDQDFELALARFDTWAGGRKIGVLFVDGPHDYRSQMLSVLLALPHLAGRAVIVVDDCNYEHVRLSTHDLLRLRPDLDLVFEAYTPCHPMNAQGAALEAARNGWWNGVHVLVRAAERHRDASRDCPLPEVGRARERCLNDHVLHAHALYDHAVDLCEATREFVLKPGYRRLKSGLRLLRRIRADLRQRALFRAANTASDQLPGERRHEAGDDPKPDPN